jgi:hypothetical protein
MHPIDPSKQDYKKSQVQFIAFRKYLEIQYSYSNISPEQNILLEN